MSEAEKTILTGLLQKVNQLDPQDEEVMLMCCAAFTAGKAAGEKKSAVTA